MCTSSDKTECAGGGSWGESVTVHMFMFKYSFWRHRINSMCLFQFYSNSISTEILVLVKSEVY
jgi:hypothetical protein